MPEFSPHELEALRLDAIINAKLQRSALWEHNETVRSYVQPIPKINPEKLKGVMKFPVSDGKALRAPAGKSKV